MRIGATTLFFIITLMGHIAHAQERDYTEFFAGTEFDEDLKEYIKKFDRFVFASENDVFVGLPSLYEGGQSQGVFSSYGGTLKRSDISIRQNERYLTSFLPPLRLVDGGPDSDIIVIGLATLGDQFEGVNTETVFPDGRRHELLKSENGTCQILRTRRESIVLQTTIFVEVANIDRLSLSERVAPVSCINWGHLFHFGFSGVRTFDPNNFASVNERLQLVHPSIEQAISLPKALELGTFNGRSRTEMLTILVGELSATGANQ